MSVKIPLKTDSKNDISVYFIFSYIKSLSPVLNLYLPWC